jgi:hypothetical protein
VSVSARARKAVLEINDPLADLGDEVHLNVMDPKKAGSLPFQVGRLRSSFPATTQVIAIRFWIVR